MNQVTPYPVTKLLELAATRPDDVWLRQPTTSGERTWTWSQAAGEVGRMAAALRELGLAPGATVAISGQNTAHWVMADMAIALAGLVSVGLYPKQAPAAVSYILDHADCAAVFVGPMPDVDAFMGALPAGCRTIALPYDGIPACETTWDALSTGREPLREYAPPAPEALMTLVYTSGSTGNPKGVMITYGNAVFAAAGLIDALPASGRERMFSYLPLAHVFERVVVGWGGIYQEAEVYFLHDLASLAGELAAYAPTMFFGVPLVYGRIQQRIVQQVGARRLRLLCAVPFLRRLVRARILRGAGLHNARILVSGSAPLPIPVLEWFERTLGIEVMQGYSLSETTLYATACLPGANRLGSVGRALPGAEIKLSDEGEIVMRHGAIMRGYYKDPEKTAEAFTEDGFFRTGDRGRIDADGYIWITGRVKEIFKTLKGKYVAPAPIEGAMRRNDAIDQACLVGAGLNQPILLVTTTEPAKARPRDQVGESLVKDMKAVNDTLEPHEKIGKLVVLDDTWSIDNGLLTPTLKVKASAVETRYAELIAAHASDRAEIAWA